MYHNALFGKERIFASQLRRILRRGRRLRGEERCDDGSIRQRRSAGDSCRVTVLFRLRITCTTHAVAGKMFPIAFWRPAFVRLPHLICDDGCGVSCTR